MKIHLKKLLSFGILMLFAACSGKSSLYREVEGLLSHGGDQAKIIASMKDLVKKHKTASPDDQDKIEDEYNKLMNELRSLLHLEAFPPAAKVEIEENSEKIVYYFSDKYKLWDLYDPKKGEETIAIFMYTAFQGKNIRVEQIPIDELESAPEKIKEALAALKTSDSDPGMNLREQRKIDLEFEVLQAENDLPYNLYQAQDVRSQNHDGENSNFEEEEEEEDFD